MDVKLNSLNAQRSCLPFVSTQGGQNNTIHSNSAPQLPQNQHAHHQLSQCFARLMGFWIVVYVLWWLPAKLLSSRLPTKEKLLHEILPVRIFNRWYHRGRFPNATSLAWRDVLSPVLCPSGSLCPCVAEKDVPIW